MITTASNDFLNHLRNEAKRIRETAVSYATDYAETDKPASKAQYAELMRRAEIFDKLHGEACRALNAVEQEMLSRQKAT